MREKALTVLAQTLIFVGIYLTSLYSTPLFHTLAEMYVLAIAGSIFLLRYRSQFEQNVLRLFLASMLLPLLAELSFIFHMSVTRTGTAC